MRTWKRRELALLAVFLLFVVWHAYDAARVRFGRMERFEITPGELETWAQEIDPSVRLSPAKVETPANTVPTTAFEHWEFEVPESREHEIVNNWERHFRAKIDQDGWRFIGAGSGGDGGMRHFQIYFRNRDSYYETYLHANYETVPFERTTPLATSVPENGHGRVRLSVDWFAVGYTRLRREWRKHDAVAIEVDGRKQAITDGGRSRQ